MTLTLTDSGAMIDKETIAAFEKNLNINLPEDYKQFMIKNNGGMPEDDVVFNYFDNVTETEKRAVIQEFYIIYTEDNFEVDNIKNICKGFWNDEALPETMYSFGSDPAGNILCISLSSDDYGSVYLCNHEFETIDTGYMMPSKIADSFDGFLNALYVMED